LAADFFLWGYVYETCPTNIPHLEQHIWEHIEAIHNDFLQSVMTPLSTRMQSAEMAIEVTCKMSFSDADD
jgi:hypothetical protein